MSPVLARRLLEAWRNHRRPPRTLHARVRDALDHVAQTKKCPNVDGVEADSSVEEWNGNGQANYSERQR